MIRNISNSILRQSNKIRTAAPPAASASAYNNDNKLFVHNQYRQFGTTEQGGSIMNAWEKSCYHEMNYTISENSTVYEAVEKFSGYDVGALIALDSEGKMAGVISERDYIKKVSLLGKTSKETLVKEVFTQDANVVTVTTSDSIDTAMDKMMAKSIRHLPIVSDDGKNDLVGFVSIKDLIKEVVVDKEDTLRALSDSVFGKESS